jgi:AbrB family looped-hinge helix DNA binding protein
LKELVYTQSSKSIYGEEVMAQAIVSEKGWIVIPKDIRERLGLKKGSKVQIVEWGGVISVEPVLADPIGASGGLFKGGLSLTQALMRERREELARKDKDYKYSAEPGSDSKIADG